jgi:hypothetical protein
LIVRPRKSNRKSSKELLAKQSQLNAALDLDKHDAQVVAEEREPEENIVPASFAARIRAEDRAPRWRYEGKSNSGSVLVPSIWRLRMAMHVTSIKEPKNSAKPPVAATTF